VSEMDWTNKNVAPSKIVTIGQEVEVMVLEIDEERRRISLGMKQCQANPWEEFAQNHHKADRVKGVIKSITDFGIFIGLPGNIDGLIHLSDLSWNEPGETVVRNYQKGQEIEAVVLSIEPERERIGLGIKQLEQDPLSNFLGENPKGSRVKGVVKEVDAKGAVIDLHNGVTGYIRASDLKRDRVEDARTVLKAGDDIEAQFVGIDRKNRVISLSVKAREMAEEEEAMQTYSGSTTAGKASLGDILKEHINPGEGNQG
jgi:small subunit ribosomal protein S1